MVQTPGSTRDVDTDQDQWHYAVEEVFLSASELGEGSANRGKSWQNATFGERCEDSDHACSRPRAIRLAAPVVRVLFQSAATRPGEQIGAVSRVDDSLTGTNQVKNSLTGNGQVKNGRRQQAAGSQHDGTHTHTLRAKPWKRR